MQNPLLFWCLLICFASSSNELWAQFEDWWATTASDASCSGQLSRVLPAVPLAATTPVLEELAVMVRRICKQQFQIGGWTTPYQAVNDQILPVFHVNLTRLIQQALSDSDLMQIKLQLPVLEKTFLHLRENLWKALIDKATRLERYADFRYETHFEWPILLRVQTENQWSKYLDQVRSELAIIVGQYQYRMIS